jgi:hypothetical protein
MDESEKKSIKKNKWNQKIIILITITNGTIIITHKIY